MVILAVCAVAYVVSTMRTAGDIPYSELRQYFLEEKVQEFSISDTRITAKLKGGSTVTSDLYDFDLFYQDLNELVQKQYDSGIITAYNYHADHSTNWLQLLLPYVLAFLGFILLMNLMNRMAGGGAGAQDKLPRFRMWPGPTRRRRSCGRSWSFSGSPRSIWIWGRISPRVCCW